MFWLNISVAATKYIIIKEIFSKVNCRFIAFLAAQLIMNTRNGAKALLCR